MNTSYVGALNVVYIRLYPGIPTLDTIITDERSHVHIPDRHADDYNRYGSYLPDMLAAPDYILEDKHPFTVVVLKQVMIDDAYVYLRLSLRILAPDEYQEHPDHKNSILTFFHTRKKEYERLIRNKKVLYKRE